MSPLVINLGNLSQASSKTSGSWISWILGCYTLKWYLSVNIFTALAVHMSIKRTIFVFSGYCNGGSCGRISLKRELCDLYLKRLPALTSMVSKFKSIDLDARWHKVDWGFPRKICRYPIYLLFHLLLTLNTRSLEHQNERRRITTTSICRTRVGCELAIVISYPPSASGIIVSFK